MTIRSNILSWLFGHPHIANSDILLTTDLKRIRREPDYRTIRWLSGQSPPDLPDRLNRNLMQDIGLDRSRT